MSTQLSPNKSDSGDDDKSNVEESSMKQQVSVSWDVYKENIQPIPQGRKFDTLMQALPLIDANRVRQQLFEDRKEHLDRNLEENANDESKQLDLWYEHIDWLEQNAPDGGKVNGITNAIERCIELYYNKKKFKQDERLFDIFMKFKRFCDEPIEIFGFMYANSICTLLARFYLNWSWQYECRKNMKRAEDLIKLGIKNLASPRDVLIEAQEQLKYRILRMIRDGALDDQMVNGIETTTNTTRNVRETQNELTNSGIRAALQTLKCTKTKKNGTKVPINRTGPAVVEDQANVGGLKSQMRIVNGVRVPVGPATKRAAVGTEQSQGGAPRQPDSKQSLKPILVFNEEQENSSKQLIGNRRDANDGEEGGGGVRSEVQVDGSSDALDDARNRAANGASLSSIMFKMPTSQPIQSIGRSGSENQVPHSGTLAKKTTSTTTGALARRC